MKYVLLAFGIIGIAWGVWTIASRADKMAQEIITVCNNRYEEATKNNQAYRVSNSENIRDNARCQADAYQSAESDKRWGVATIAVGTIISFILSAARRKASL